MKLEIYTKKETNNSICYLCGCTLEEYVENIPEQYMQYEVQRGIVPNVYLDKIIDTMLNKENIPTITLIADKTSSNCKDEIILQQFKILDGLQRTYRIKAIWECVKLFNKIDNKDAMLGISRLKLSKMYREELKKINSDVKILESIIKEYKLNGNVDRFIEYFNKNIQWFEVWKDLSPEEQIDKMLILNAGHKSMSVRHQLELLYLNVLPYLDNICDEEGVEHIIREKEKTDTIYSKGREVGQYYFSHLISATLAFDECKPKTTNTNLIKKIQEDNSNDCKSIELNYNLLESVLRFWIKLDKCLYDNYGDIGAKWLSRETVVVGIFAAIGKYSKEKYKETDTQVFNEFILKVNNKESLNIYEYDKAKNSNMNISKINIGNVTKNTIFNAIYDLMIDRIDKIRWNDYFGGNRDE
ncbi:hypothetical protein ACV3RC_04350 [Clostridium perfringens]|uniref:hypothetical protein n=1 Tax=Clostridium perfringens TaxID=1502 RepID=UPI001C846F07|nr:hypothetical protein [Clostridium perfringens]EHK2305038.1 hypothetical protein [Clostridium perfringens]MDK0605656.1 hypothetical protein [Clostridium perfringens]MDK0764948.1 hypothetical protein [Clostridium perfringens]MDK0923875.1 hypothetical protein [Clostridium perfringens]MDM0896323.1 hypothetical protein [Clostridium perfringens]